MKKTIFLLLLSLMMIMIPADVFAKNTPDRQADAAAHAYLESLSVVWEKDYGITDLSVLSLSENRPLAVFDLQKSLNISVSDSLFSHSLDAITAEEPGCLYLVYADEKPISVIMLHETEKGWQLLSRGNQFQAKRTEDAGKRLREFTSVPEDELLFLFSGTNLYAFTPGRVGYLTDISGYEGENDGRVYTTRMIVKGHRERNRDIQNAEKNGKNPNLTVGGTDGVIPLSVFSGNLEQPLSFLSIYRNELLCGLAAVLLLTGILVPVIRLIRHRKKGKA